MKKTMAYLLIAAMLLSLCGCGLIEDTVGNIVNDLTGETGGEGPEETIGEESTEISGDIRAAREAYESLSEADKTRFYEEIAAERKAYRAAKNAELLSGLYGEWCMENPLYGGYDSAYADGIRFNEDMTFEYGRLTGIWYFDEAEELIWLDAYEGEEMTFNFTFRFVEEDGFVKLLNVEGEYCYVRKEDYHANLDKKYVIVLDSMMSEYLGEPKYAGTYAQNVGYGPNAPLCVLDSLAYEKGLIYVGTAGTFSMEIDWKLKDGSTYTSGASSPFEYMRYYEDAQITDIRIEGGIVYFIRSEYVEDIYIDANGSRTVLLKNGSVYYGGSEIWRYFPELTFEDFAF